MEIPWKAAALAAVVCLAAGMGLEYRILTRRAPAPAAEGAAHGRVLPGGGLLAERRAAADLGPAPQGLPAGSRVDRAGEVVAQGGARPSAPVASPLEALPGLPGRSGPLAAPHGAVAVPRGAAASWDWTLPAVWVAYDPPAAAGVGGTWRGPLVDEVLREHPCPPVTIDWQVVSTPDGGRRMVATSPDGRVLKAVDFPALPPTPGRVVVLPRWRLSAAYFPGPRAAELDLDRRFGPFALGAALLRQPGTPLQPVGQLAAGVRLSVDF